MNWETGRFHVDSYDREWMVVFWRFLPLKLVKDSQMANDTWLPGCKCGTGLSPVIDLAHGWQVVWLFRKFYERRTINSGVTWVSEQALSCRHVSETIVKAIRSRFRRQKGSKPCLNWMPNRVAPAILGYGDETDPDSVLQCLRRLSKTSFGIESR